MEFKLTIDKVLQLISDGSGCSDDTINIDCHDRLSIIFIPEALNQADIECEISEYFDDNEEFLLSIKIPLDDPNLILHAPAFHKSCAELNATNKKTELDKIPTQEEIKMLDVGCHVKAIKGKDIFWAKISENDNNKINASIYSIINMFSDLEENAIVEIKPDDILMISDYKDTPDGQIKYK